MRVYYLEISQSHFNPDEKFFATFSGTSWGVVRQRKGHVKCLSRQCGFAGSLKCTHVIKWKGSQDHDPPGQLESTTSLQDDITTSINDAMEGEKKKQTKLYGYLANPETGEIEPNCHSVKKIPQDLTHTDNRAWTAMFDDMCPLALSENQPVSDAGETCRESGCTGILVDHKAVYLMPDAILDPY